MNRPAYPPCRVPGHEDPALDMLPGAAEHAAFRADRRARGLRTSPAAFISLVVTAVLVAAAALNAMS